MTYLLSLYALLDISGGALELGLGLLLLLVLLDWHLSGPHNRKASSATSSPRNKSKQWSDLFDKAA